MYYRNRTIDLTRFFGALIIMGQHMVLVMPDRPFDGCWIYVEFFLIISGYYTVRHFDGKEYPNPMREGIFYTIRKFLPYLPYTIGVTVFANVLDVFSKVVYGEHNLKSLLFGLNEKFFFDILLITGSFSVPMVGTLWYLSALLIVFPLFCRAVQIRNRYWVLYVSFLTAVLYYGICGVYNEFTPPMSLARVFSGLCIGSFLYELTYILGNYFVKLNKLVLTLIEIVSYFMPIIIVFSKLNANRFILLCFGTSLAIMLSGRSYSTKIEKCGDVCTYLGRLSLPIYIVHVLIGQLIRDISKGLWDERINVLLYYSVTIVISMIVMYLIDHWRWYNTIIMKMTDGDKWSCPR